MESETDERGREGPCEKRDPRESRVSLQVGRSVTSIRTRESLFILALSLRGNCRSGKLDPIHDPTKYSDVQWRRRTGFYKGPLHVQDSHFSCPLTERLELW